MNSSFYVHKQKQFQQVLKPISSISSMPDSERELSFRPSKEYNIQTLKDHHCKSICFNKTRHSNILDWFVETKQSKSIFFFISRKIILPNLIAFILVLSMMMIENEYGLDCWKNEEKFNNLYIISREIITYNFFFLWILYLIYFDQIEKKKYVTLIILVGNFTPIFVVRYFKLFDPKKTMNIEIYIFPGFFQMFFFIAYNILNKNFGKKQLQTIFLAKTLFALTVINYLILRKYLIEEFHLIIIKIPLHKVIFQCFLFLFYHLHGKCFFWFINKFRNLISKNLFLFLIKMHIVNVITSCLILPLMIENDQFVKIFALLNFSLQIFSLYKRQSFFSYHFFRVLKLFFSLKTKKCCFLKLKENNELKLNMAGSTNEIMIAITIAISNILIFEKTLNYPFYDIDENKNYSYCRKKFGKEVNIQGENYCFLLMINFFYFLYLIMKMKDKKRSVFSWKVENYKIFTKALHCIMICAFVDSNFQYYLYLYLLEKN